jgi:hypothetical protein
MITITILSWIGNACLIAGLYGIGNKWRPAFLLSIVGELAWIVTASVRHDWALVSMCSIFGAMAVRSYIKWK